MASEVAQQAEAQRKHKAHLENVAQGRELGIGNSPATWYSAANKKEEQWLVQEEVWASVEEEQKNQTQAINSYELIHRGTCKLSILANFHQA